MNDLTKFFAVLIVCLAVYNLAVTVALIRTRKENRELVDGIHSLAVQLRTVSEEMKKGRWP